MPLDDKTEVHRIISSNHSDPAGKTARESLEYTIYIHYRDSYTRYKFLNRYRPLNDEAIAELREKIKKIIDSWRGGNDSGKSSEKKTEGNLPNTQPSETSND